TRYRFRVREALLVSPQCVIFLRILQKPKPSVTDATIISSRFASSAAKFMNSNAIALSNSSTESALFLLGKKYRLPGQTNETFRESGPYYWYAGCSVLD